MDINRVEHKLLKYSQNLTLIGINAWPDEWLFHKNLLHFNSSVATNNRGGEPIISKSRKMGRLENENFEESKWINSEEIDFMLVSPKA